MKFQQRGVLPTNLEAEPDYADIAGTNYQNIHDCPPLPTRHGSLCMNQAIPHQQQQQQQKPQQKLLKHQQQSQSQNFIYPPTGDNRNIDSRRNGRFSASSIIIKPEVADIALKENGHRSLNSRNSLQDRYSQAWYRSSTQSNICGNVEKGDVILSQQSALPPRHVTPPTTDVSSVIQHPSNTLHSAHSKSSSTLPHPYSQPVAQYGEQLPPPSATSASMHSNLSRGVVHKPLQMSRSNPGSGSMRSRTSSRRSNSIRRSTLEMDASLPATDV